MSRNSKYVTKHSGKTTNLESGGESATATTGNSEFHWEENIGNETNFNYSTRRLFIFYRRFLIFWIFDRSSFNHFFLPEYKQVCCTKVLENYCCEMTHQFESINISFFFFSKIEEAKGVINLFNLIYLISHF